MKYFNIDKFIKLLEKNNFEKIHTTDNSYIFYFKKTNKIIKIYDKNQSYNEFINYTIKNYNNSLPKIFGIKDIPNSNFKIVKLENLEKLDKKIFLNDLFSNLLWLLPVKNPTYIEFKNQFKNKLNQFSNKEIFLKTIYDLYKNQHGYWDIHADNIMTRNNELVIVDPCN